MIQFRRLIFAVFINIAALLVFAEGSYAQYNFEDRPLSEIIQELQSETGFRFLYREALVSGISLSLDTDESQLFSTLNSQLSPYNLGIKVDSTYNQAVIFKQQGSNTTAANKTRFQVSGQVVDAASGERLPFATLMWKQNGNTNGISANKSGTFQINRLSGESSVEITCSYVGYHSETFQLGLPNNGSIRELTFRLEPQRIDGNELIVTGTSYYGQVDERVSGLVDIGMFSPLGSSNSIRALQSLPSTSLAPALSDGMHVRGSPADGFHVLLDGITVFNQSHLFGLLDSFNADVLQRSGFFYDIAPAQYQAPPGGTLSMVTQTGSLNDFSASLGASNTSYRLTMEGPLKKGTSSWLISGRSSYLNSVSWLNNSDLIQWGLDVNRPREILDENLVNVESRLIRPGESDARFFDLHGKLYFEEQDGSRFILSGYYGGDHTEQQADRLFRSFNSSSGNTEFRNVSTQNDWNNGAGSFQFQDQITDQVYLHSTAGVSIYRSEFLKEDFSYTRVNRDNGTFQSFTFPFENKSILNDIKVEQQVDINLDPWLFTTGGSYHYYLGEYYEDSFDRPGFLTTRRAHKIDLYGQLDYTRIQWLDLSLGSRWHYYSNGDYLRWSPRVKLRFFPRSTISVGGGYSRNFQFLNKISLSNTVTSDVWILTNSDQPPTGVEYYSAGIYIKPNRWLYLQLEGYHKNFSNVRLHEINAFSLTNTFNNAPWYANNDGTGRGLELMVHKQWGKLSISQTLTISEMLLSNPTINDGDPFYVDWDRRYRYGVTLETELINGFFAYLSWMYASGAPNRLATFGAANEERLGHYHRTDITLEYKEEFAWGKINASVSFFNLFDRQNPWYRDLTFVLDRSNDRNRFRTVPVDVYDIGFQPSFNLSFIF